MRKGKALLREEQARGLTWEKFRGDYLRTHRRGCAWPWMCGKPAPNLHHRLSRAQGGALMDASNIVALCLEHHAAVHANPAEARLLGLSRGRWKT